MLVNTNHGLTMGLFRQWGCSYNLRAVLDCENTLYIIYLILHSYFNAKWKMTV